MSGPTPRSPYDGAITFVYRHVLHREATPADIADWSTAMENGLSFDGLVDLVSASDEAASVAGDGLDASLAAVGNVFCIALGRRPAADAVAGWTEELKRGRPVTDLVTEILASSEVGRRVARQDTRFADEVIAFVYRHALGRSPSAEEVETWAGHLRDAMSYPTFLRAVVNSEEGRSRTAEAPSAEAIAFVYRHALGREPSGDDLRVWTDLLGGGVTFQGFLLGILASEEARRPAEAELLSDEAVAFVYRQAVGRKPSDADLAEWSKHFEAGLSFQRFLLAMASSEEALSFAASARDGAGITDGQFVAHLFEICLGRCALPAQIQDWTRRFAELGYRRPDVAMSFIGAAIDDAEGDAAWSHDSGSVTIMGTDRVLNAEIWASRAAEIQAGRDLAPPGKLSAPYVVRPHAIRVSAIASLYKGGRYIRKFLDNMTRQSLGENFELIVVDANSPDGEREVIEEYRKTFPNIRYERMNYRIGIYDAWNVGVELARGDYLTNTNLDDLRRSDSLELQAATLDVVPFADVVYQDFFYSLDPDLSFEQVEAFGFKSCLPIVTPNNLLAYNSPHNAPMWRKRLHAEVGPFDVSLKSAGDHDFWLRCLQAEKVFYKINTPHVVYYQNPDGISTRPGTLGVVEGQRILKKYGRRLLSPEIYRDRAALSAELTALCGADAVVGAAEDAGARIQRAILAFVDVSARLRAGEGAP